MLKKLGLLAIFIPFLISTSFAKADQEIRKEETPTQTVFIQSRELDSRAVVLKDYLAQYDSPLQNNAQDFIEAADKYGIDWKLVPAISGVESTFGRQIPGGYNGWGWGVYGDQAIYFNSWKEAIFTISEGLKKGYIDQGLTNPYAMNTKYAASPTWGTKVDYFLNDIDKFTKNNQTKSLTVLVNNKGENTKLKEVLKLKETLNEATSSTQISADNRINVYELALSK